MSKFIRIAIDLGKNYFQVHGLESEGGTIDFAQDKAFEGA